MLEKEVGFMIVFVVFELVQGIKLNDGCRVVCQEDDDLKFEDPWGVVTMDNGAWMSDSALLYRLK